MRRTARPGRCTAPALALALGLTACSIPDTAFHATPDAGSGPGSMSDVLAIVVSSPAIELDEGATTDFTVQLNHAPAAPVEIDLSTASQKIGLSIQKLFFDATNFAQAQTITVTGIRDDDTTTEIASIKLSGAGLADIMVGATVHDPDKVTVVTNVADNTKVTEKTSLDIPVHLSHRPPGDVVVTATLSSGPMTVSPASRVFHMDDSYSTDVVFTVTAPADANASNEMQTITFGIAGGDQKILQLIDVDVDKLAIVPSPTSIAHLLEGDSVTLNLTLSLPPSTDTTVMVATTSGKAQISATSVTFLAGGTDYKTNHPITITAPQDNNTTPETDTIVLSVPNPPDGKAVDSINIPVQIDDDDVQAIQTTVVNSLTVSENATKDFGVTLKFAPDPSNPVTVNLGTLDAGVATAATPAGANFLTFTATDYNDPTKHPVRVQGTHDNNLVTNSTTVTLTSAAPQMETDVLVDVLDIDQQAFVLTPGTPLSIPEGTSATFTLALAFVPTTTVTAQIASDSAALVIPASSSSFDFTPTSWNKPVTVTVSAPVDKNNVSESGTISIASSPTSPTVPTATVAAKVMDSTTVISYGWPAPPAFTETAGLRASAVIAYKIHIDATNLDTYGIDVPVAAGAYRMALYNDNGNKPDTLVGTVSSQFPATNLVNGVNIIDVPDVQLATGDYWLALRVSATTNVAATTQTTGRRCNADFDIVGLANNWPATFGVSDPTTGCMQASLLNIWITTYHQ
ncbi:MAG TPA: hypothetical protein VF516_02315 [Kofleriaceae bacterium]